MNWKALVGIAVLFIAIAVALFLGLQWWILANADFHNFRLK